MNIGLIGTGRIGQVHTFNIHNYIDGCKITHAFDPIANEKWLSENNIIGVDSVNDLLECQIDCVLVCSPSSEHIPHIISIAKKKKHIFCEKPVGLNIDEIESAIEIIKREAIVCQIGFNRRFDPTFTQLQNRIKDAVGTPQIIRITSRDPEIPPENYIAKSGGIFFDMAIHDFDMARFLASSEVVEVFATGSCLIDPVFLKYNDIDTSLVQLKFANGTLGVIDNSRRAVYGYDQRIEVFSNKACLKAENRNERHIKHYDVDSISNYTLERFFLERYRQAYINQFISFFNAIRYGKRVSISAFDGLQAVKIAKAAHKSFQIKAPVKIQ